MARLAPSGRLGSAYAVENTYCTFTVKVESNSKTKTQNRPTPTNFTAN